MATANSNQIKFINKIKQSKNFDSIVFAPSINLASVDSLYLKDIIVVAPDERFKGIRLPCPDCKTPLSIKGWHDKFRYLHLA